VRTARGTDLAAFAAQYRAKSISKLVLVTAEWLNLSGKQSFTPRQIHALLAEAKLAKTASAGVYLSTQRAFYRRRRRARYALTRLGRIEVRLLRKGADERGITAEMFQTGLYEELSAFVQMHVDASELPKLIARTRVITQPRQMTVVLYFFWKHLSVRNVRSAAMNAVCDHVHDHQVAPPQPHRTRALWEAVKRGWVMPLGEFAGHYKPGRSTAWRITKKGIQAVERGFANDTDPPRGAFAIEDWSHGPPEGYVRHGI
jgi:hypothetical protein